MARRVWAKKGILLGCLLGATLVMEGEVWIDGERADQLSEAGAARLRRTKLGFVFQSRAC